MKITRHILSLALLAYLAAGCGDDSFDRPDYYGTETSTGLAARIVAGSDGYFGHVKSDTETRLTQGVNLLRMSYLNSNGRATQLFLYKVSLGGITIRVTLPDDKPELGNLQVLSEQAAALEKKSVYTVWGAVTGGLFAATGQPTGILYHEGAALKPTAATASTCFFAVLNDGSAVCLPMDDLATVRDRIAEATGGQTQLLSGGYPLPQTDVTASARTAVGVSADGGEVYLLTVDGGDFFYSGGISFADMATLMRACGASDAITLNSGANVSAVWRNERLSTLFGVLNKPSNNGLEAPLASGLAIVER